MCIGIFTKGRINRQADRNYQNDLLISIIYLPVFKSVKNVLEWKKNAFTLSSKATVTSKRCIVWKLFIFQNSDFFYLRAYLLRFLHAKFQHFLSSGLGSTSFLFETPFEAFQLFISDMNGGVSLQTSVTFKRFELGCWDWSQIEDFLKEIILGSRKKNIFCCIHNVFV